MFFLKHKGKSREKKKFERSHIVIFALILFLAAFLIAQIVEFVKFRGQLEFLDSLEGSQSQVIEELGVAKQYLSSFGSDLNQVRSYLLLPTTDYDFSDLGDVELEVEEDLTTQIFQFVEELGKYEANKAKYEANLSGFQAFMSDSFWTENGLAAESAEGLVGEESVDFTIVDITNGNVTTLEIALAYDGVFSVEVYNGELDLSDSESVNETINDIKAYISENLETLRSLVVVVNNSRTSLTTTIFPDASFQAVLAEKALSVSDEKEAELDFYYEFYNADKAVVADLRISKLDGSYTVSGSEVNAEDPIVSIVGLLSEVDSRTAVEVLVDEKQQEIENLFNDRAFIATLEQLGLSFGEAEETDQGVSYPIMNSGGSILRILYLDKSDGEVKVVLPDNNEVQSLAAAIQAFQLSGKKKLWTCLSTFLRTLA